MHKICLTWTCLLLVLFSLYLGSCRDSFDSPAEVAGDLRVSFTRAKQADLSARTLVPADTQDIYVRLRFTPETEGIEPVEAETSASSVIVRLSAGTWNIQAQGWPSKGDWETVPELPIFKGQGRVSVQADTVKDAQVLLYPQGTGTGLLQYTIQVPGDTVSALLRVYPLPETPEAPPVLLDLYAGKAAGLDGTLTLQGSLSLAGGFYRGALDISRGAAGALRKNDTIHIYDGLTTAGTYTFTAADFSPGETFSDLVALKNYLDALPENTADTPYLITLSLSLSSLKQGNDDLGGLFAALSRYAAVDLQACTVDDTTLDGSATARGAIANLVSLILPNGIEALGDYALYLSASLEYLALPDTLKTIGNSALRKTGLISLRIPGGVTSLGTSAIEESSRLERLDLSGLTLTSMGNRVFAYCPNLEEVILPPALPNKALPDGTFYHGTSLVSANLPANLETIGSSAFYGCTALSALELPATIKAIGQSGFSNCTKLMVDIGSLTALETLGYGAFQNCGELQSIRLSAGIRSMGPRVFESCGKLSLVELPAALVNLIDYTTFRYCRNLQFKVGNAAPSPMLINNDGVLLAYPGATGAVSIPEGVNEIPVQSFQGEMGITSLSLPASLQAIGDMAFYGCSSLESVSFPAGSQLQSLGFQAFYGTKIASISLPATLTAIADQVFYGCASLVVVEAPATTPPDLGTSVFTNTAEALKIYVPDASVAAYKTASNWSAWADRINGLNSRP